MLFSKFRAYYLVVILISFSCKEKVVNRFDPYLIQGGWKSVYHNDEDGNRLEGSIDSLISGIRNGYDIKVGWGWQKKLGDSILRIEHVANPTFVTIIQEKNVSILLDEHPLLESYIDIETQNLNKKGYVWQCVLTTKGTFNAQVIERTTGKLIKDWPQKQRIKWFLEYPLTKQNKSKPLF